MHARQFAFNVVRRVRYLLFDPGDIQINAAVRASPALFDLPYDAARDMIAGQELRRASRIFVALSITPAFFFVVRGLSAIIFRNGIEHETSAELVRQDTTFTADPFGYQNSNHARRPDHSRGMKLHEFHID